MGLGKPAVWRVMQNGSRLLRAHMPLESPLEYLPRSRVADYEMGQVVYNQNEPPTSIYLVLGGRVKVSSLTSAGREMLLNICQIDEFFGESAFLHLPRRPDRATALEDTTLMTWNASELEE